MANVKLSNAEMELINNSSIILTKNQIIEKVYQLFGKLSESFTHLALQHHLPENIISISPKISRGENYEGLPWVMLDYPRYFRSKDFFAIRTFFWWGNFISITLQIKGRCKIDFEKLNSNLIANEWFLCINENEWEHHFREDNYVPLSTFSITTISTLPFIKLATKIPLSKWDDIENILNEKFAFLLALTSQPVK
jgi:hypothetical protein